MDSFKAADEIAFTQAFTKEQCSDMIRVTAHMSQSTLRVENSVGQSRENRFRCKKINATSNT